MLGITTLAGSFDSLSTSSFANAAPDIAPAIAMASREVETFTRIVMKPSRFLEFSSIDTLHVRSARRFSVALRVSGGKLAASRDVVQAGFAAGNERGGRRCL